MNGNDLLNGLGFVDDELVQEAEQKKIKGNILSIKFLIPIAACFAVMVTVISLWTNSQSFQSIVSDKNNPPPAVTEEMPNHNTKYSLYFNLADSKMESRLYIMGHFWEKLSSNQAEMILPRISKKYRVNGTVSYSHTGGKTTIFSINTNVKIKERQDVNITIAPNEVAKCVVIDGEPMLSQIEGVSVEAGIFTATNNKEVIFYADFKIDDVAYYVEFAGDNEDKAFFTNVVADIILGDKADLSVFNPIVPELRDDRLTEEEAYGERDFGGYLPEISNNYQFNDAIRFINQDSNFLLASWSDGLDDIRITISNLSEEEKSRITAVKDTQLYDMSLYPIPWSESVPRDISEIVDNPVFKVEELTLRAVKMRGYTRNDSGDTSSINMRFSVLYNDIVVEVSTEGVSAEYLFQQLTSLPR